jgi:glutamate-1-semialdehyde 2,1-aminomutase
MGSNLTASIGLAYYMRRCGVYIPEVHTMTISAVHSYNDLEVVAEAFDRSLKAMIDDNFFVL